MNNLPLIEKIHLLESKLGNTSHSLLMPFTFNGSDIIKVQEVGKIIARHVGLDSLTFIIIYAQQSENVAGHINLNRSNDVFIEIDSKFNFDCDIILSILAHEICHKYLYINDIILFPEYENEMLTDAATIFTGLGKLSLNGCEKTSQTTSTSGNTTTTTITTHKIGYMNRRQFAFVYQLVSEMWKIPKQEMFNGLRSEVINEIIDVNREYNRFFNNNFFSNDFTVKVISDSVKNEIGNSQKNFAIFNRNIRTIQESVLPSATKIYTEFHLYTRNKIEDLLSSASKSFNQESHNYIKNLLALTELDLYKVKILEKENEMKIFGNSLQKLIKFILTNYPQQFSNQNFEFLFQFECPYCNNKMRIGEKKLARVKCQKCNYSFIIDTGTEVTGMENRKKQRRENKIWAKIKSFFKNL
jgi:hypothetical protein